jgi:asparagine synthase (glutamine-hydrolysing)
MLSFQLHLADLVTPSWSWTGERWASGRSWIKPVMTPALEWGLASDPSGAVCVVVRERRGEAVHRTTPTFEPMQVAHVGATIDNVHTHQGDYVTVEMRPGRVRVTAGPIGTAPVYLAPGEDELAGSWSLPDLRAYLSLDRLCSRAVVRALTRQHRYSTDTLFTDLHRLTERAAATFTAERFVIDYPTPALHVMKALKVRDGADVVGAFHGLVAQAIAQVPPLPNQVGIELSGGADSANVALSLAAVRDDLLRSYGLAVDGVAGEDQRDRRRLLVKKLGMLDTEITASDHPPFALTGVRALGIPHDPTSAYYREAFDAIRDAAAADGLQVMFTGLGGDEITALRPDEQERESHPVCDPTTWLGPAATTSQPEIDVNLAPIPVLPLTTLMAFALHNPTYLQAGIWPVAPLANPAVVRFAEQLPVELRRDKQLLRQRLHRAGLPQEVTHPATAESFSDLMQVGLRQRGLPLLEAMLRDSVLVDTGYLDHDALRRTYDHALTADRIPSTLCDSIALEVGLRSLLEPVTAP